METTLTQARGAVARSDEGWAAPVLQPRNGPSRTSRRPGRGRPSGARLPRRDAHRARAHRRAVDRPRLARHAGAAARPRRSSRRRALRRLARRPPNAVAGRISRWSARSGSGGVVLPIVVGRRRWRSRVSALAASLRSSSSSLAVESASYRTTTLVVHRHRPEVHRLENLPVNASYPSGHTAASIAVYCGLALLLTSRITNRVCRSRGLGVAVLIPVFVAFSRMYRGMHHPLDVAGGVVIGDRRAVRRSCLPAAQRAQPPPGSPGSDREGRRHRPRGQDARRRAAWSCAAALERAGVADPLWYEVPKSRKAPKAGAPRCSTREPSSSSSGAATARSSAASTSPPARTSPSRSSPPAPRTCSRRTSAIPQDIEQAVAIGLDGERRQLDVGRFNGERFAVMAGAGFDAAMIRDADGGLKDRLGRAAYVWAGSKNLRARSRSAPRSRSTASAGSAATRRCFSSATSAS